MLGDLEDKRLGVVDGGGDVLGDRVAELGDLAGGADEAAEKRELLDDARVVTGASPVAGVAAWRRRRMRRATDRFEQVGPAQLVGDGDRVGRLAPAVERGDGVEDVDRGRACRSRRRRTTRSLATMASRERSIAPSSDSSASMLCGGTRRSPLGCGTGRSSSARAAMTDQA